MAIEDTKRFRRIPGRAVETTLLIQRLREGKPGDIITDDELMEICGKNCAPDGAGYGYLHSAIKFVEAEGIVWGRVRDAKKIKCLEPDEVLSVGTNAFKQIARKSKRTVLQLGSLDTKELTDEQVTKRNAGMALSGTLAMMASHKTAKRLEEKHASATVDFDKMLEIFQPKPS